MDRFPSAKPREELSAQAQAGQSFTGRYTCSTRQSMCHLVADTTTELNAMADTIGVARKWIQQPGTIKEHYDMALSKRQLAVKAGALEITGGLRATPDVAANKEAAGS
jgi:hypothetical protein